MNTSVSPAQTARSGSSPCLSGPVPAGPARPATFRLPAYVLALLGGAALLAGPSARAANTPDNVVNGQTDLTLATSYSAGLPTATSDVVFTNVAYSPAAFTLNSSLSIGTLNDLSPTALTIQNTSGTADTLTLSTAANSVSGTAADLLFVNTGSTLSLGGGAGNAALNLTLAVAGNFNIAGTANVSSAISASGLGIGKTGAGTLSLLGAGTSSTGRLTQSAGTINFGSATDAPTFTATDSGIGVYVTGGNFNVVNGTFTATSGQGLVLNGNNTYTQTGGTFTTNGRIELANGGGTSTVNVSAGTLSTTATTGIETVRGTSVTNLSGTGAINVPIVDLTTTQLSGGAAGGTFNLNGGTLTTGQIIPGTNGTTGAGTVFNFNGGLLTSSASSAAFLQGITSANVLAGGVNFNTGAFNDTIGQNLLASTSSTGGGLTKTGTGTLTLTGTNTYTGTTTISAGILQVGDGTTDGSITTSANIVDNGTLAYNRVGSFTFGGVISGTGALTKTGAGSQTLTGANTYTGNTTVSAGTLTIGGAGSLGGGAYAGAIANAGTFNYNSTAAQTLSGVVSGAGALTQSGTGTLTLSGANTYTGATTINGGTLAAGVASVATSGAFGVNSAVTLANVAGATLSLNGFNESIGSLTGGGATGGVVALGANALTVGGNNTSPASYAGTLTGTGTLSKVGTGTLILGGNGTSSLGSATTGGTIFNIGGGAVTFGSATEAPTLTVAGNSVGVFLTGGNFNMVNGTVTVTENQGLVLNSSQTYTQTGGTFNTTGLIEFANGGGASVVNISGGSLRTTNSNANDATDLAVRGTTTVNLSGTGTFTTPVLNMTTNQIAGSSTTAGTANSTFNLNAGGTLATGRITGGTNGAGTTTGGGAGTFNFNGGTLQASASSATFLQGITAANVQAGGAIINTNGFSPTIAQPLLTGTAMGTPDGGLTKNGTGILTLTAANTFTGPTTLNQGALTLTNSASLSDTALLNIANGTAFNLNAAAGTSETVGSLILGGTAEAPNTYTAAQLMMLDPNITFSSLNGETLTVAGAVPEPSTWAAGLLCLGALGLSQRRRAQGWLALRRA